MHPAGSGPIPVSRNGEDHPTFICFLNWTDQGAKDAKDSVKRYQASKARAEKLGGRLPSAYVTTGQYDLVATVEMPDGAKFCRSAAGLDDVCTAVECSDTEYAASAVLTCEAMAT